jgi:hypothetical protein
VIRVPFDPANLSGEHRAFFERWSTVARKAREDLESQLRPEPESKDRVYREFKKWLGEHFFGEKCAYCEGPLGAQTSGAAEHWRPKGRVEERDNDGRWRRVKHGEADTNHPGYWWMAFSWENLVPACAECNAQKGNKFPIAGDRVFDPGRARDAAELDRLERPLLLHPFRGDDPAEHIGFDRKGFAFAKSSHGTQTLEVCDLNRNRLVKARFKTQQGAANALATSCTVKFTSAEQVDVDEVMREWDDPTADYSRAVREVLDEPEAELLHELQRRRERRERERGAPSPVSSRSGPRSRAAVRPDGEDEAPGTMSAPRSPP